MNWQEVSRSKNAEQVRQATATLDVNERDERGRTPLMLLLTHRMPLEGIRYLLQQNRDLETEDKLGDTVLKKAVRFKQADAIRLLVEYGASLNSPQGIYGTAWYFARGNPELADLLLDTPGAIRLKLNEMEQAEVDAILYEESMDAVIAKIRQLSSDVLLHAVVRGYNWDDGPEPMFAVFNHPACAEITMLDMYEWMEASYWLDMDEQEVRRRADGLIYRQLALLIKEKCQL